MKIKKRIPKKKEIHDGREDLQVILKDIQSTSHGFIDKYRTPIIIAVVVISILIIGTVSYKLLTSRWNKNASVIEYKAYNYFREGNYSKAISSFQEITDRYAHSKSAPVALYYTGNSYSGLGQYDDAIRTYKNFIDKYSDEDTILPLVYLNLGSAYMNKKDYNSAITTFKEILTLKDSLVSDRAVYEMAKAYEASGDTVNAIERYEYLTKTYPASSWGQEAKARLSKVKGDAPILTGGITKDDEIKNQKSNIKNNKSK